MFSPHLFSSFLSFWVKSIFNEDEIPNLFPRKKNTEVNYVKSIPGQQDNGGFLADGVAKGHTEQLVLNILNITQPWILCEIKIVLFLGSISHFKL